MDNEQLKSNAEIWQNLYQITRDNSKMKDRIIELKNDRIAILEFQLAILQREVDRNG